MTQEKVLYVKHLPSCLTSDEKSEFLKYFGASQVRVMPDRGRLKHSAFVTFKDNEHAKKAIARLHQTKIHDSILSVEFAKEANMKLSEVESSDVKKTSLTHNGTGTPVVAADTTSTSYRKRGLMDLEPIAPHLGLQYPADPGLKYKYPEANADIVLNICCALFTIPKFYTQVLHLMNKMSMVPPFSPASFVPKSLLERIKDFSGLGSAQEEYLKCVKPSEIPRDPDRLEVEEMSESESEYESSGSEGHTMLQALDMAVPERVINSRKRKKISKDKERKRKLRISAPAPDDASNSTINITEAFEELQTVQNAIPSSDSTDVRVEDIVQINTEIMTHGFGKLQPQNLPLKHDVEQPAAEAEGKVLKDYITEKQLDAGRLSKKERSLSALFKNYKKGDPTCRLYVKNLSKRVKEKDLLFIYGSFVTFEDEEEKNMFDIKIFEQGRMKGQAFIGFSSVEAAAKALDATNGYQLMNRPMVVQFAMSKRPK